VSVKLDGFRLEWRSDPLSVVPPVPGRFRFDAPDGSYPVTYSCSDELGCFAEVFGDTKLIEARDGERHVLRLGSRRRLRLLELDDGATLMRLGLDARICVVRPYDQPQAWSSALHRWYARLDGLSYVSRREPSAVNVCLFLDRCADAITVEARGLVRDDLDRLERVIDRYPIATTLLF
jgi:hypothetical protein